MLYRLTRQSVSRFVNSMIYGRRGRSRDTFPSSRSPWTWDITSRLPGTSYPWYTMLRLIRPVAVVTCRKWARSSIIGTNDGLSLIEKGRHCPITAIARQERHAEWSIFRYIMHKITLKYHVLIDKTVKKFVRI